ncbi:MAG: NYN domain-containing protein [Verrucomicrobiae bacterium]|nr:NYN domain-containing protein [Verrucomicrobiae bacterium]MCB1088287.1 NYN domain-containing protein [Verrucomicrobiae bacterium]
MNSPPSLAFLIVDGNNVIHAWSDLLELHRKRRGLAHLELCRRLREFNDQSDYRVVVVFDGKRSKFSEEREPGGFQIVYTDGASTADDVIERLAGKYAKQYRLVVATDDAAEQSLVSAMGAEVWSAQLLRDTIDRSSGNWRKWLK